MASPSKILPLPMVSSRTNRSRSAIYQDIKNGKFPLPVHVGARRIGFLESEIDAWIAERVKASRPGTI